MVATIQPEKCKLMKVGKSPHKTYTMTHKTGATVYLETTNEEKDVGVWVTTNLKPTVQCQKAAKKAMQALGMVKRSFKHMTKKSFVTLYRAYVCPHLKFCVQAWCPYLAKDIDILEKVQRRATKLVTSIAKLTYEQRLQQLKLYSLYYRRQRGDLIETYKILNGIDKVEARHFFQERDSTATRGHTRKLFKQRTRLLVRQNYFSVRAVDQWNRLPQHVVDAKTVTQFKARLDKHWNSLGYGHQQRPMA